MKLKIKTFARSLFALAILSLSFFYVWGCSSGSSSGGTISNPLGPTTSSSAPSILEKSDSAVLIPSKISQKMIGIASNGSILKFDASDDDIDAQLLGIVPGAILVGAENSIFPNGFLRKVVSVTKSDSTYSVETVQASLAEAVNGGKLTFQKDITDEDIESFTDTDPEFTVTRPSLHTGDRSSLRALELSEELGFKGKIDILGTDLASISLKLDSKLKTSIKIEADFTEETFLCQAVFKQTGDFLLSVKLSPKEFFKTTFEKKIAEVNLRRFIIAYIGPVPIWVKPSFPFNVGYDMDISGKAEIGLKESLELTCGSEYDKINGWQPILEGASSLQPVWPTDASIEGKFQVYFQPVLSLEVCDVVGPEFKLKCPFFEGKATLSIFPPRKIELSAVAGAELTAALKFKVFSKKIAEAKLTRRNEILLASATIPLTYPTDIKMEFNTLNFRDSNGNLQVLRFESRKLNANLWAWSAIDDSEGVVAGGNIKTTDDGKIIESTAEPAGPTSTIATPYFTYDPDGSPMPAFATMAVNANSNTGNGICSGITVQGAEVKNESVNIVFGGGNPTRATSYSVVGSERGFIGAGTIGIVSEFNQGGLSFTLTQGYNPWLPNEYMSFYTTAEKGTADSVSIMVPQPYVEILTFSTNVNGETFKSTVTVSKAER